MCNLSVGVDVGMRPVLPAFFQHAIVSEPCRRTILTKQAFDGYSYAC